jgi:hypothetical protein
MGTIQIEPTPLIGSLPRRATQTAARPLVPEPAGHQMEPAEILREDTQAA